MKRSLTLIFSLLLPQLLFATSFVRSSLSGRVTDKTGAPLPGAVIVLPDLNTGAVTDTGGRYLISDLPSGKFVVTVKLLSFASQSTTVTIIGESSQDFVLSEAVLEQHEVIVTGTSTATEQRRNPSPIQTISASQMRENVSTNVIDAITRLPGVQQLSTGPAISKPVIRGLGYNRIITLNDGIRQEGQQWGDEHGIEIDDYNVSKVEVLKGPASLSYGSDAIAGVINILSEEPAAVGTITGNINAGYQTNNGMGSIHGRISGNQQGYYWSAYYTGKAAHDYRDVYDGAVYNSRFNNNDFGASVGVNKHWGSSRLAFSSYSQHLGISEGQRDSVTGSFVKPVNNNGVEGLAIVDDADAKSYTPGTPSQHITHEKLSWVNNLYLSDAARVGVSLGLQQNERLEYGNVLQPDEPGLNLRLRTFNYDAHYLFAEQNNWQISAGINGMLQGNRNRGIEFLVPDYDLFDLGGYLIGRKELGKWLLSGGARIDYRSLSVKPLYVDSLGDRVGQPVMAGYTRFAAFSRSFSSPSGSIGISYNLDKHTSFKANISAGYRAPNIAELAANGVHEGTIRYEYGNPNLRAENSYQGDLGAEYSSQHFAVNAAVFYNHISDFIYTRKLKSVSGTDSIPSANNSLDYPAFVYDQSNANLYGAELFVDLHPHPLDWLHFENTISYVTGLNADGTDSTKYLPNIPGARWLIGLRAQARKPWKRIGGAYVKVELDHYFEQLHIYAAYGTETPSPAYSLVNASLGFDILQGKKTLASITIAAQNLGDIGYQNHLSRLRYADLNMLTGRTGIFGMGRNVSVQVAVPLSFK